MKRAYEKWNPDADTIQVIRQANAIIGEYQGQGYDLTLRQLYYQFVARDYIPNNQRSYKRLGSIVDRGRKAGLVDWSAIVDRTRNLESLPHWTSPAQAMLAIAQQFRVDLWQNQPTRVEVWVEKEALAGVVERAAEALDCAWFSCRGYVSQSEVWEAGRRFGRYLAAGQNVVVLHLGDHDPSGIDMTRDIRDRLQRFVYHDWFHDRMPQAEAGMGEIRTAILDSLAGYRDLDEYPQHPDVRPLTIHRIALNMDQVEEYEPPPNPAKITDSRSGPYISEYGDESWELDALEPGMLVDLITEHIVANMDEDQFAADQAEMEDRRQELEAMSDNYEAVAEFVAGLE